MTLTTATDQVAALRARQVCAVELLDETIARIEADDARLNAVVVRDFERARVAAVQADAALARGERLPLLGLPMTVKECFNVAGWPTTWGLPGTQQIPVHGDAVAVARLKAAGAVIVGKTNVSTMLADWQCFNEVYGTTNNPWDLGRTPGGSSGGAAAALAAGFVALEVGSDIGGSLRIPAHCCGVFSHKPTHALVPMRGCEPPGSPMLSVRRDVDFAVAGPMARSAADLALALDVLAGPDDAQALAWRLALPAPRHARLRDHRVLVLDEHPLTPTSDEVRAALHGFVDRLEREGCTVGRHSPLLPDLERSAGTYHHLLMAFFGADMPEDHYRALAAQVARLPPSDRSPDAMQQRGLVSSHRDWIAMDRVRQGIVHQWREFFRQWDVVLCPVMPTVAFAHDHGEMSERSLDVDGRGVPYGALSAWISLATLAGLPVTTLPVGLGVSGLPVGVQIIGPCLEDRTTIGFAELAERAFGGFVAPPPVGS